MNTILLNYDKQAKAAKYESIILKMKQAIFGSKYNGSSQIDHICWCLLSEGHFMLYAKLMFVKY